MQVCGYWSDHTRKADLDRKLCCFSSFLSFCCQDLTLPSARISFYGCRSVVIGATNRKADLDAALLSRFDLIVTFGLPDEQCREKILQRYARHLTAEEVCVVACNGRRGCGRGTAGCCGPWHSPWGARTQRTLRMQSSSISRALLPPCS